MTWARRENKKSLLKDIISPTKTAVKISYTPCQAGQGGDTEVLERTHSPAHHQPQGLVGPFHQGDSLPPGAAQRHLVDVDDLVPRLQSGDL